MRVHEHILLLGFLSLYFESSEKKRRKMLNELELKRLPISVFSEKVPTNTALENQLYRSYSRVSEQTLATSSNRKDHLPFFCR